MELLKSERFNNRLLCEIISHEKFKELLADAEIYVDGMATMRFHDMNLEEHPEATADRAIKVLEACQVEEEDFFCLVTHKTWDAILHDIRKAHEHEKDTDSAPEITPAQGLILSVRKAMQTPGDYIGKLTKIFCEAFGVSYKRLSEQEKETLQGIFKKARLVQNSRLSFRRRKK